jgi:hypothetical protein
MRLQIRTSADGNHETADSGIRERTVRATKLRAPLLDAKAGLRRRRLPFLERGGVYWGAPPDDATAIGEFERMRREAGPAFIAFGWPSFWWLEHYPRFAARLRETFPCVLENERLVVFDLRG